MASSLTIALAQCNFTVGDIAGNVHKIQEYFHNAVKQKADLVIFSELSVTGYPPEDLLLRPSFQREAIHAIELLVKATAQKPTAMLVGCISLVEEKLYNTAYLIENGKIIGRCLKNLLPTYGVFDEGRVFSAALHTEPVKYKSTKFGIMICEDLWQGEVTRSLAKQGAEIFIGINASPFEKEKHPHRLRLASGHAELYSLPFIYVNQVGGQDELVFDGGGFVVAPDGKLTTQLPFWEESLTITEWKKTETGWKTIPSDIVPSFAPNENLYQAMMTGLRDYIRKNNFPGVIIGLSGGVDSALSAAVAVDALGKDNVHLVMMPSRYTSDESILDAEECAEMLGCHLDTLSIEPCFERFLTTLAPVFHGKEPDVTEENLQSRIRCAMLMALSNKYGKMVLTTGNKSELAVGYATLYGDMSGGYNVLKDIYKTEVFAISRWRNRHFPKGARGKQGMVMPDNIIAKAPTAELRSNQKDQDSLPKYDLLDDILFKLIEQQLSAESIIAVGYDRKIVEKVARLLYLAEYKRRQSPPGVKVSSMNFGRDRRYPITNKFNK